MPERLPCAGRRAVAFAALMSTALFSPSAFARQPGDPTGQTPGSAATPTPIPWYQTISINGLVSTSYVVDFNAPASRTIPFRVFDASDRPSNSTSWSSSCSAP